VLVVPVVGRAYFAQRSRPESADLSWPAGFLLADLRRFH